MNKLTRFASVIIAILFYVGSANAQQATPSEVGKARDSVYRVGIQVADEEGTLGSAFAITSNTVVTNAHVLEALTDIEAKTGEQVSLFLIDRKGNRISVSGHKWFKSVDLGTITTTTNSLKPLKIRSTRLELGEGVWALGYPGNADLLLNGFALEAQQSQGVVQSYEVQDEPGPRFGPTNYIRHDAEISGGSSGGPMLDSCGNIVAINTFGIETDAGVGIGGATNGSVAAEDLIAHLNVEIPGTKFATVSSCRTGFFASSGIILGVVGALLALIAFYFFAKSKNGGPKEEKNIKPKRGVAEKSISHLCVSGSLKSKPFEIGASLSSSKSAQVFSVGRTKGTNDISIGHGKISGKHLQIQVDGSALKIMDVGSSNGTIVRGQKIQPQKFVEVSNGEIISLADLEVKVELK